MPKVFGNAIYSAFRTDGILHIVAIGQKPYLQTKVSLEQLPFFIFPPEFGLFFETDGIANPVVVPFEIEKAFPSYPKKPKFVRIQDASGGHEIAIQEIPKIGTDPLDGDPDKPDFLVYRQINTDAYMIAKVGQIVPAIYTKVFGPDTLDKCREYIDAHSAKREVELLPGTMKAWISNFLGPNAHPKLIVTVDAFIEIDWKVALTRAEPQGINPAILLLKLNVEMPHGKVHSDTISKRTLRYEEDAGTAHFGSVTIENGADSMSAPVELAE